MRFNISTRVDGNTIQFQEPINDPFVNHQIHTEDRWFRWLPWPKVKHTITVLINGDYEAVRDVMRIAGRSPSENPGDGVHRPAVRAGDEDEV